MTPIEPEHFAYFDRCKGQETAPPVQICEVISKERRDYCLRMGYAPITEEYFEHQKGLGVLVV